MNIVDVAMICKALGDSNRLQIIKLLSGGEKCACELLETLKITQPTLSHHMKILCECRLVKSRKNGKWTYYSVEPATIKGITSFFNSINASNINKNGGCL